MDAISLPAALGTFSEPWSPRTVATVNDYDVRIAKADGEFARHSHPETDEFFLILDGTLTIRMDEGDVTLHAGDVYVVPRGVSHQPVAEQGASILLFEPSTTVNTGDSPGNLTAPRQAL
jgi:mannose-6-phosphate isomerase-like protein (cupin superfamily)